MRVRATEEWETLADKLADQFYDDYAELARWVVVAAETGLDGERPFALVAPSHLVFKLEAGSLYVLAVRDKAPGSGCCLTHIGVRPFRWSEAGLKRAALSAVVASGAPEGFVILI